jgi:hypothetical protein
MVRMGCRNEKCIEYKKERRYIRLKKKKNQERQQEK